MKKQFIITGIIVTLLLAVFIYGFQFAARVLYEKQENIHNQQQQIFQIEQKQKNIRALEKEFATITGKRAIVESVFANERTIVSFIEDLERIAAQTGAALSIDSAILPTEGANARPEFRLVLNGSFNAVYRSVKLIQALPYQTRFVQLSIGREGEGESEGQTLQVWQGTMRLTLLSFLSESQ